MTRRLHHPLRASSSGNGFARGSCRRARTSCTRAHAPDAGLCRADQLPRGRLYHRRPDLCGSTAAIRRKQCGAEGLGAGPGRGVRQLQRRAARASCSGCGHRRRVDESRPRLSDRRGIFLRHAVPTSRRGASRRSPRTPRLRGGHMAATSPRDQRSGSRPWAIKPEQRPEALAAAEKELLAVLADPVAAPVHNSARGLLRFVRLRLEAVRRAAHDVGPTVIRGRRDAVV